MAVRFDGSSDIRLPLGEVYEKYLAWGGQNKIGDIAPIDAAMSYDHNANRLQFANPDGITIEYSRDNGATWLDYNANNGVKVRFVSGQATSLYYGKRDDGMTRTVNDQLRITINASKCGLYTNLKTVLINGSTGGQDGCQVKIERAWRGSEDIFDNTIGTFQWSGWSGWNSYVMGHAFGGGQSQTSNWGALRFTFFFTGVDENYNQTPQIINMMMFGTTHWLINSQMMQHGHLYSWDWQQNATFPNGITAKGVVITDALGFNYTGMQITRRDAYTTVWYSDSNQPGTPTRNNQFSYNAYTNTLQVGSITGNAVTADHFSSARTVKLSGNVTGSASSNGDGWNITTTIPANTVTNVMLAG